MGQGDVQSELIALRHRPRFDDVGRIEVEVVSNAQTHGRAGRIIGIERGYRDEKEVAAEVNAREVKGRAAHGPEALAVKRDGAGQPLVYRHHGTGVLYGRAVPSDLVGVEDVARAVGAAVGSRVEARPVQSR